MTRYTLWSSLAVPSAIALFAASAQIPPTIPDPASPLEDCQRRLTRVADAHGLRLQPGERLVSDREGRLRRDVADGEVRLHYLVDRRIGGCAVPVVSPTRLDEANRAVGRVLGREDRRR